MFQTKVEEIKDTLLSQRKFFVKSSTQVVLNIRYKNRANAIGLSHVF
jgi:hypothetical protein